MAIDLGSAFGSIIIEAKEALSVAGQVSESLSGIGLAVGGAVAAGGAIVAGGMLMLGKSVTGMANDTRDAALNMQAQFGMTAEEAEKTAKLARAAWADNWGESIDDVSTVMGTVIQQLGDFGVTSDEEITRATTHALGLRDTFGTDVPESIDAARALMERFGLTSDEAFNMITSGMQNGLSANGDFLESITEYAPVFEAAGFTAEQMYSIMESGAASGVLGTDKIADAVKEMGVILSEGGERAETAFQKIGMNYNEIAGFVESGDEAWADYFDDIVEGINSIEDPLERQQVQVAIFGTMAEDLGANFTEGLTAAGAAMSDFEGSTDSLAAKSQSFGQLWEGFKRQTLEAFAPVGDFLVGLAAEHLPAVQEVIGTVAETIGSFFANLEEGMSPLDALIEAIWDIAPPELLAGLIDFRDNVLPGLMEKFTQIKDAVLEFVAPIAEAITQFVSWKDVLIVLAGVIGGVVLSAIVSIVTALGPVLLIVGAVIAIVALLRNAWESNFGGIQDKTAEVIAFIRSIVESQLNAVRLFWDQHGAAILATVERFWGLIQSYIEGVIEVIYTVFEAFRAAFEGDWETFGEKINEAWETAWNTVVEFLSGLWDMIRPWLASVWESIKTWFTDTDWKALGESVISGIVNGLNAAGSQIADTIAEFVKEAWERVKAFFGIASPSRLMFWAGQMIGQGLIDGIRSRFSDATGVMDELFSVMGNVAGLAGTFGNQFQNRTLEPLREGLAATEEQIASMDETMARLAGEIGYQPGFLNTPGAVAELMRMINYEHASPQQRVQAQILLDMFKQRNQLQADYLRMQQNLAAEEARLAALQSAQADNQFLQEQLNLLKFIRENNLPGELLNGITLGLGADAGQLMDVMRNALLRMLAVAQETLGIASPSRPMREYGRNLMASLGLGISEERAVITAMREAMGGVIAAAGQGGTRTNIDNGRVNHLYGGQHFYIQRPQGSWLDDIQAVLAP